jgi:putative endonuclease
VKLRRGTGFGHPLEAITPRKRARLRSAAARYLAEKEPLFGEVRFDAVGILQDGGEQEIVHVEDAF